MKITSDLQEVSTIGETILTRGLIAVGQARTCTRCCTLLPLSDFYEVKLGTGKYRANCKVCFGVMDRKRIGTPKDKYRRELGYRAKWSEERLQERSERNRRHQRECKERKSNLLARSKLEVGESKQKEPLLEVLVE